MATTTSTRRSSSPPHIPRLCRMDSDDNPQQFGFENIVFEIDNRCDDQKIREPPRFCSLAQFVEGSDIARQSFKVSQESPCCGTYIQQVPRYESRVCIIMVTLFSIICLCLRVSLVVTKQRPKKRSSLKQTKPTPSKLVSQQQLSLDETSIATTTTTNTINTLTTTCGHQSEDDLSTATAIRIEVSDTTTSTSCLRSSPKKSMPGQDVKRITFDDSCKKESFDDVTPHHPQISVVVRPPTPLRGDAIRPLNPEACSSLLAIRLPSEIRRHSSHATTLTVREFDKDKDRRHSGFNPNYLSLDPEHSRFLNSSPAASRRISCGSLFKVSFLASTTTKHRSARFISHGNLGEKLCLFVLLLRSRNGTPLTSQYSWANTTHTHTTTVTAIRDDILLPPPCREPLYVR